MMDPEPMLIDSTNGTNLNNNIHSNNIHNNNIHNNKTNGNNHTNKEIGHDLLHLKNSVLDFIASHERKNDSLTRGVDNEYIIIVASVFDKHVKDPKAHYKKIISSINSLISEHKFNRNRFLRNLQTSPSLPPLLFVFYLHIHDIVSLGDFLENLQESKHDEFIQQLKEAFDISGKDPNSHFDDIIVGLVNLVFENSDNSVAATILGKTCDPKWSARKIEALKRLLHVLKRASKMRPAKISTYFFATRLLAFFSSDGPNSELSILEDRVKKILNPPTDTSSIKSKEDETKDILDKIFGEFCAVLPIEKLIEAIIKVALTLQGDWDILVKFIRYLISTTRDFGTRMADPLHDLAREAVANLNEDLLKVTFMLSWIVLPFNLYIEWFTTNFCASTTTMISSKNLRQLLARVMTALVSVESMELQRNHRSTIKKHPDLRPAMHDYLIIDRSAPAPSSSSIGKTASVDDAISNARKYLESFRQQGKIPEELRTTQYFGRGWFKSTFIPTVLSLEEEQKHAINPEFKDIHLFVKALQTQGVIVQNDVINWKASQDEHTAKVKAAQRLAKGRSTDRSGRRPIDPLKSLLREFVDRARVHNFQGGAQLAEITPRINDLLATHQDQTVPCVNLLLHTFCEISVMLAKAQQEGAGAKTDPKGKGAGAQLTGDFVRRILMLPSLRAATRERIRELVCDLALELDDAHIACLALLLAHLAVATEREGPTENATFANEIFRHLHAKIRNVSWMGFAAKFCSKFVAAIPVVASYVIVPDSLDETPTDENEPMSESPYDYSFVPPLVLKLLLWLKSRYAFGQQVVSLCSSHTTLHHHTPTFIDFSTTSTLLLSVLPPSSYSHTLARLSGCFSLEEFVRAEMNVAACGDFLDGVWKAEYVRKMLRETYAATQPFASFLENLVRIWLSVEPSESDPVCACSKAECNGKSAILAAIADFVDSENADTIFGLVEKELENSAKSQAVADVLRTLSTVIRLLAHVHPLAFNLTAVKSLLYALTKYLKFLVPYQATPLPHMVTHPSSLLFVFLARVFGSIIRKQPEHAAAIKDMLGNAPQGFFFTMNAPLYRKTMAFVGVEEFVTLNVFSSLDSVNSWIQLLMQGQCNSSNLKEVIQTVTSLPTIAAHALFHSTLTLSSSFPSTIQPLHDKVAKVEPILSLLCGTLTKFTTFDAISQDKTFEFLANFTDILVFFLSSSPSYTIKQLRSPTTLPTPFTCVQHQNIEDMAESLLSILLIRSPFLLAVLSHPPRLPFLTPGRSSLFPSFSSPSTFSSCHPFVMYLTLTSIPFTTLGKILGGPAGPLWQEILLEAYAKKTPHPTYNLTGNFREKIEQWICGWIERCGLDAGVAERVLPSLDLSSLIATAIQSLHHGGSG